MFHDPVIFNHLLLNIYIYLNFDSFLLLLYTQNILKIDSKMQNNSEHLVYKKILNNCLYHSNDNPKSQSVRKNILENVTAS